jgi:Glucose / Sorbosone dehydrogenase/NHL repeat
MRLPIEKKSLLNFHIQYKTVLLFLISITLVSSSPSLYPLPLVYSQEFSYSMSWREAGRADGRLLGPEGIAVDPSSGNVYVVDTGNNRIQVFSSNGTFITRWGNYGSAVQGLRYPQGIAADQEGNVYVVDTANNRILAFSRSPITNVSFSSEDGEIYGNDTRIKITPVYEGLGFPTAIAFLGPNDMVVLRLTDTRVMRIVNGQMLDEPVLDLRDTVKIKGGCMCDIAILKNDSGTSYAFLYYAMAEVTEGNGTTKFVNSLYRYNITDGKFTNPKLIFEIPSSPKAIHNGGKLMVGPDNNIIYLTIGDINNRRTQAENNHNGPMPDGSSGILRFTPNGDAVDSGLLGNTHPLNKYYAYGIRNSFGLNYDPFTGNIWMTDNGEFQHDELNLVRPGFNGGWNKTMASLLLIKHLIQLTLNPSMVRESTMTLFSIGLEL